MNQPTSHRASHITSRGRRVAVVGIVVAVLVIVGGGIAVVAHVVNGLSGSSPDYDGSGSGTALVVVHDGDTATAIGESLAKAGVVRSAGAFTSAASVSSRAASIQPGTYRLHEHMKASLALSLLLSPSSLVDYRVTIPEGFTAASIVARVAADTPIPLASLKSALAHPASLGLPGYAHGHVEGFLFPATYDVQPGMTAASLLRQMVARFAQAADQVDLAALARRDGLSEYQVVTLASIVQREGRLTSDFPGIAEVFLNRLHAGMTLGSDATLYYVLGPSHGPLTATDLALDSPYNTRLHDGLPPTPINSPGTVALGAVLHHATSSNLYFVTIDKAGHTAFATTLARFNQLVARSRANGVS